MAKRHCDKPQIKLQAEQERAANLLLIIGRSHRLAFTSGCCMQWGKNRAERDTYQWIFLKHKNAIVAVKCAAG